MDIACTEQQYEAHIFLRRPQERTLQFTWQKSERLSTNHRTYNYILSALYHQREGH